MTNNDDFISCLSCKVDICYKCCILHLDRRQDDRRHHVEQIVDYWKKKEKEVEDLRKPVTDCLNAVIERGKWINKTHEKIIALIDAIECKVGKADNQLTEKLK